MRKKTKKEKEMLGTYRPDKELGQVGNTVEIPKPEAHLSATAKKIYQRICEHLVEHGNFCGIDSLQVSAVAHAYDEYARITKYIKKKDREEFMSGTITTYKTGARQLSHDFIAAEKHLDRAQKGFDKLGMNPKSRAQIAAFTKDVQDQEDDELNLN